jgi:hypothetical protein
MIQPPFDIATLWTLSPGDFDNKAKLLSEWQAQNNPVYKEWIQLAKLNQLVQEEALFSKPMMFLLAQNPLSFLRAVAQPETW